MMNDKDSKNEATIAHLNAVIRDREKEIKRLSEENALLRALNADYAAQEEKS